MGISVFSWAVLFGWFFGVVLAGFSYKSEQKTVLLNEVSTKSYSTKQMYWFAVSEMFLSLKNVLSPEKPSCCFPACQQELCQTCFCSMCACRKCFLTFRRQWSSALWVGVWWCWGCPSPVCPWLGWVLLLCWPQGEHCWASPEPRRRINTPSSPPHTTTDHAFSLLWLEI